MFFAAATANRPEFCFQLSLPQPQTFSLAQKFRLSHSFISFRPCFFPLPPTKRHKRPTDAELDRGDKAFDLLLVCLFVRPAIIWFRLASSRLRIVPRYYPFSLIVIVGVCGLQRFLLLESSSQVRSGLSTQNSQAHGLNDDEHPLRFQHRRPTPLEC